MFFNNVYVLLILLILVINYALNFNNSIQQLDVCFNNRMLNWLLSIRGQVMRYLTPALCARKQEIPKRFLCNMSQDLLLDVTFDWYVLVFGCMMYYGSLSSAAPYCAKPLKTHRPRGAALCPCLLLITASFPLSCLISFERLSFFQCLRFFILTSNNNNKTIL